MSDLPHTQHAIQFTGVNEVTHNPAKPLTPIGPHDIVLQVDACGICFSDTKLLHAFDSHPRKSQITRVVATPAGATHGAFDPASSPEELLAEIAAMPQHTPGDIPSVPGHEPTAHIVAVGSAVTRHQVGERVLVQTDYRHLPTPAANAAFGYTFEGALQEYVVVDERVVIDPKDGERFLIPVSDAPTRSAVALVEPWACVEAAYAWSERQTLAAGSCLLIVVDPGRSVDGLAELLEAQPPALIQVVGDVSDIPGAVTPLASLDDVTGVYDDIIYVGADAATVERLAARLGFGGLLVLVLGGSRLDRLVNVDVGRVHYDLIRFAATTGSAVAAAYGYIPANSELRPDEKVAIIGAAGPMGLMHTMRTAVSGVEGVSFDAVDVDDSRLNHLAATVAPVAESHQVPCSFRNSQVEPLRPGYSYLALMVPAPALVAQAVELAGPGAVINAFAGFAIGTLAALDLNIIAERGVYLVGTSGSRIQDMKAILAKVEAGVLDTNVSLDAVCGMAGVEAAIESVNNRTSTGKIMVYPSLAGLGLVRLADLPRVLPEVAAQLDSGRWTKAAEEALLRLADTGQTGAPAPALRPGTGADTAEPGHDKAANNG